MWGRERGRSGGVENPGMMEVLQGGGGVEGVGRAGMRWEGGMAERNNEGMKGWRNLKEPRMLDDFPAAHRRG